MNLDERKTLEKIQKSDVKAFELLFHHYYSGLCRFAYRFLQDEWMAEEVVQNLFVHLWEKRKSLQVTSSLENYLLRSVKNACLNKIQQDKTRQQYIEKKKEASLIDDENLFREVRLELDIKKSIEQLPAKRRQIFLLSREKGMSYKAIAHRLNISVKTVEKQMNLAIKHLKFRLKHYLNL